MICHLNRRHIPLLLKGVLSKVDWIRLANRVVQIFWLLSHFCLFTIERGSEVSNFGSLIVCFPCSPVWLGVLILGVCIGLREHAPKNEATFYPSQPYLDNTTILAFFFSFLFCSVLFFSFLSLFEIEFPVTEDVLGLPNHFPPVPTCWNLRFVPLCSAWSSLVLTCYTCFLLLYF